MKVTKARNYCFTINNYTQTDIDWIIKLFNERGKYLIYGKEVGKEGTPHIQAYIELKENTTFNTIKKYIPRGHIEVAKGSQEQNIKYCSKDGTFTEMGEKKKPGERTDIIQIKDAIINGSHKNFGEVMTEFPEVTHKYFFWCKELFNYKDQIKQNKLMEEVLKNFKPINKIQQYLVDLTNNEPNSRAINWIYDEYGNNGKTYICKNYFIPLGAFYASGGKKEDIAHAYNGENVILLDFPRSWKDYINYGLIEKLKDGLVFSGKYNWKLKVNYDKIHLIVLWNSLPDTSAMSADRWNIITVHKNGDFLAGNTSPPDEVIKKLLSL